MVGPGVAAEHLPTPAAKPSTREVAYDQSTGLISIQAHQVSLDVVLQELSRKAALHIIPLYKDLLREQVSIEMDHLPLEQALKKLVGEFNSIFLYASTIDSLKNTITPRLVKVILAARQTTMPLEARPDSAIEQEEEHAGEPSLKTLAADEIPTRPDAHAALQDLAPETAGAVLESWLQGNDQQLRVFAAARLGEVGDDRAIKALSSTLAEDDSLIGQIAANSLAQIGGEEARRTLIAAYLTGDDRRKQAAATAIASYGDAMSQQALASLLGGGQAFRGQTAREIIVQSLRRPAAPD